MTWDLNKALALFLVIIGTIILTALGRLDGQAATGLLGAALGYVFGNGHGLAQAKVTAARMVSPVLPPTPHG